MPQKIFMCLSNGNGNIQRQNITQNNYANLATVLYRPTGNLQTSMISRIHDLKPGCSSCGRKG